MGELCQIVWACHSRSEFQNTAAAKKQGSFPMPVSRLREQVCHGVTVWCYSDLDQEKVDSGQQHSVGRGRRGPGPRTECDTQSGGAGAQGKELGRYEDTWAALHRRAKECASAGELVDSEVVMLSAHWEKKQTSLVELQQQLQQLPGLIADLESMTANLRHGREILSRRIKALCIISLLQEVGNRGAGRFGRTVATGLALQRIELEKPVAFSLVKVALEPKVKIALCSSSDYRSFVLYLIEQVFSQNFAELDAQHTQKVLEMEQTQQVKLKERQKFFEEAFQQDMEQYLSTGYLQIAERRGNMSSMEVNVDMLEQMDLMDISDQEALDVFLNSGGEDSTVLSPDSGLDAGTGQHEVTLEVPHPSHSRATPPASPSPCTDPAAQEPSEGEESPVVQSDEEGVEVDTALATLHTDDSDS
ncbi:dysbindin [Camelus ferus]|nr:dysbindin [Camelus ferus]